MWGQEGGACLSFSFLALSPNLHIPLLSQKPYDSASAYPAEGRVVRRGEYRGGVRGSGGVGNKCPSAFLGSWLRHPLQ